MKNSFKLLLCLLFFACGSSDESDNDNIINMPSNISVNLNSISFENTMVSQVSESKVFIITTENITSGIEIISPDGYEISNDNTTFSQNISFTPELSNDLYVRFKPSEAISYYSTLVISSDDIVNNISINLFGLGTPLVYNYQAFDDQQLGLIRQDAMDLQAELGA